MMKNVSPDPSGLGLKLAQSIIQQEIDALTSLAGNLDELFLRVAQELSGCCGLIWVTGVGTSAAVGARFAHILTDCGARSMFLSPSDGLHGHSAVMTPDDLLVAMSRGGESSEIIQMVELARVHGATSIGFVHNAGSSLAMACDVVLTIQSKQEYELMGFVATTSTVAFCAICDALSALVLEAKGYTAEELGRAHPGGAVGKVLSSRTQGEGEL
jgi:D-arabinose 5-phosphate isomerase GutQ